MTIPIYENLTAIDGTVIRAARLDPEGAAAGVVQIVHGFGESIIHYVEIMKFFVENGYACVIHDQRGHGEMAGLIPKEKLVALGFGPGYEYFLYDVKVVRDMITRLYPQLPVILYGHSMGGNIAVNYLFKHSQGQHQKVILESPWFRLYKPIPRSTLAVAELLGGLSFNIAPIAKLRKDDIFRNSEIIKSLERDDIYQNRVSFRLISQICEAGELAIKNAGLITIPTLLLCPASDKIVCPNATREFARRAGENVSKIEYPDGYHALRYDDVRDDVLADIGKFL